MGWYKKLSPSYIFLYGALFTLLLSIIGITWEVPWLLLLKLIATGLASSAFISLAKDLQLEIKKYKDETNS